MGKEGSRKIVGESLNLNGSVAPYGVEAMVMTKRYIGSIIPIVQ